MQRAAYVHHLRLGGRSSRTYALYCEGCGLARAGVSKATVARHKDDGRCAATSIKLHVSAGIMLRVASASCLMTSPLPSMHTQADPNTAPPQLRDLCLGAERALRYVIVYIRELVPQRTSVSHTHFQPDSNGDAQGLADFLVSQGVNCPPRYAPSTLAHAAPAMADAPAYHPLPPLASSRSSVATMAPAAAAGGSNQVRERRWPPSPLPLPSLRFILCGPACQVNTYPRPNLASHPVH